MRQPAKLFLIAAAILAEVTVAAHAQTGGANKDANRLICRRVPDTGSLVSTRRQCFTKAQWDRMAKSARTGAEKTIGGLAETSQSN